MNKFVSHFMRKILVEDLKLFLMGRCVSSAKCSAGCLCRLGMLKTKGDLSGGNILKYISIDKAASGWLVVMETVSVRLIKRYHWDWIPVSSQGHYFYKL